MVLQVPPAPRPVLLGGALRVPGLHALLPRQREALRGLGRPTPAPAPVCCAWEVSLLACPPLVGLPRGVRGAAASVCTKSRRRVRAAGPAAWEHYLLSFLSNAALQVVRRPDGKRPPLTNIAELTAGGWVQGLPGSSGTWQPRLPRAARHCNLAARSRDLGSRLRPPCFAAFCCT